MQYQGASIKKPQSAVRLETADQGIHNKVNIKRYLDDFSVSS